MKILNSYRATRSRDSAQALAAGFSLVELMAVILILAILMTFLVTRLGGAGDLAKTKLCRTSIAMLEAAIGEYESEFGSYPPSKFKKEWGAPPNTTNLGAESLIASLWSKGWGGVNLPEDQLINSDQDRTKKALTSMPTSDLLELADPWENPIAYFSRQDYDRTDVYLVMDPETGEIYEANVKALKNPITGRHYKPHAFQLISAGSDGEFGTEDDVTNFARSE